jgi:hypothetical protein
MAVLFNGYHGEIKKSKLSGNFLLGWIVEVSQDLVDIEEGIIFIYQGITRLS